MFCFEDFYVDMYVSCVYFLFYLVYFNYILVSFQGNCCLPVSCLVVSFSMYVYIAVGLNYQFVGYCHSLWCS